MSTYLFLALTLSLTINGVADDNVKGKVDTLNYFTEEGLFLGTGMGGVVITLSPGFVQSDLRDYISHLDRSQGSIEALVPAFGTGPFNSLLDVVGGEHSIDHRDPGIEANRGDPF
jgi:hypothetical protein